MKSAYFAIAGLILAGGPLAAEPYSINDALKQAVQTNPGVGEASANRRATESELRQTQSTLLPQVRIEARYGPEKFDQSNRVDSASALPVPIVGNGTWRNLKNQWSSGKSFSTGLHRSMTSGVNRLGSTLRRFAFASGRN